MSEPMWTDVATAIGTVGAVVVSLGLAAGSARRERARATRAGARELLEVLADAHRTLPRVRPGGSHTRTLLDRIHRVQLSLVLLMDPAIQQRWGHLRALLMELAAAQPVPSHMTPGPDDWTSTNLGRARQDVDAFIEYLRESVTAAYDGSRLPPDTKMPYLRREDPNVWSPPVLALPPAPPWGPSWWWRWQGFDTASLRP